MHINRIRRKWIELTVIFALCIIACFSFTAAGDNVYAASITAKAVVSATGGTYVRSSYNTSAKKVTHIKKGTKVTLIKEVFTKADSTAKSSRWYYVSYGSKKGYVRSDYLSSFKYNSVSATAKSSNAVYRKGPSDEMKKVGTLSKGKRVNVRLQAVLKGSNEKWYRIKTGSKTGYIRSDLIKIKKTSSGDSGSASSPNTEKAKEPTKWDIKAKGVTKPGKLTTGQEFELKGTLSYDGTIDRVVVGIKNSDNEWVARKSTNVGADSYDIQNADSSIKFSNLRSGIYRYRVNVVIGNYVIARVDRKFEVVRCKQAAKLLKKETLGGEVRIVGTFDSSNCSTIFSVKGDAAARVPQGMTYANGKYYLVYGLEQDQAIVTYSAKGEKLGVVHFPDNILHPNGIAWNPKTKKCYVFIAYTNNCYSWDPATDEFVNVNMPFYASGVAYDTSTKYMYATSKKSIRICSRDGKFTKIHAIQRCERTGIKYAQDCGAARGFIFHCVSGEGKHGTNYIDVYRASTRRYMGTIKTELDELEGVIIDDNGFIQLLSNTTTTTDYIWKTPLNIYDLK